MNRESLQRWLDRYIDAWRTYDPAKIGDLFAKDALYLFHPYDDANPIRGREAIIANWLETRDDPKRWRAQYEPLTVDGPLAVANGRTRYLKADGSLEREFHNLFVMQFDEDGRCTRFTEWFMQVPQRA